MPRRQRSATREDLIELIQQHTSFDRGVVGQVLDAIELAGGRVVEVKVEDRDDEPVEQTRQ
jgi:hypothetical protein